MIRGSDFILQAVEDATGCAEGGLSEDKLFGVDIVQCQGACVNAPLMVVNDDYFVSEQKLLFYISHLFNIHQRMSKFSLG